MLWLSGFYTEMGCEHEFGIKKSTERAVLMHYFILTKVEKNTSVIILIFTVLLIFNLTSCSNILLMFYNIKITYILNIIQICKIL